PRIRCRALNGRTKIVVAYVARTGKRLRQFDESAPPSTPPRSHIATAFEKRFHAGHRRDPMLQQQILKPRRGKTFQAVPHHIGVLRLRNAAPTAKRSQDSVKYTG